MDVSNYAYPELKPQEQTFKWCHKYAHDVINGHIRAGKWVKAACERHFRDIHDPRYYFDEQAAHDAITFFKFIPCKINGKVLPSTVLLPWQQFLIGSLFGLKVRDTGFRKYEYAYVQIARKGGKSTLCGGIALYMMLKGGYAPQVYSLATTRDQAAILWKAAKIMVNQSPLLKRKFKALRTEISLPEKEGMFKPLASQSHNLDGLEPTCAFLDECHAVKDRNLYEVIESSFGSIKGDIGQLFAIVTTAGFILDGLCVSINKLGKSTLSQQIENESYFFLIAEIDEGDDPFDEDNWHKANLGLEYGLPSIKTLRDQAQMAKASKEKLAGWLTKRCNVFVSGFDSWLDMRDVEACRDESIVIDDYRGRQCFIGIDKSMKNDLTSIAILFPTDDGGCVAFHENYLPRSTYDNAELVQKQIYKKAIDRGDLTLVEGKTIRDPMLRERIIELNRIYAPDVIATDAWKMGEIIESEEIECANVPLIGLGQQLSNMSEPSQRLESLMLEREIKHNNSIFEWCCQNAVLQINPQGHVRVGKQVYSEKIDSVVATVIALSVATLGADVKTNTYLSRGLLTI